MNRLEPLSADVLTALGQYGVRENSIQLCASADLDQNGSFGETWIVVTQADLFILAPEANLPVKVIPVSKIEQAKAESLNGNGLLVLTVEGEPEIACRYSNTLAHKFGHVARLLEKLKKGEELREEDFSEDLTLPRCPTCGLLYPNPKRRVCPKCLDKRALFVRVLSFMPRYKRQVVIILICMAGSAAFGVLHPYLGGRVLFDETLTEGGRFYGQLGLLVTVMAGSELIRVLLQVAMGRVNAALAAQVVFDLKTQVFAAMQRLSLGFFVNKETGNLMTRVNHDAMQLQFFFHDGVPYFIVNLITLLSITAVMFLMNWRLTLLVLIPTPLIVLFTQRVFPKLWRAFFRRYTRSSAVNSLVNDTLTGMRVVKAFGKEDVEINRFARRNQDLFDVNLEVGKLHATMFPSMSFIMGIGGLLVWAYGGWRVTGGDISFGLLMTFLGYLGMVYGPLEFMTHIVDWWSNCMNSAQRIFEVIDAVPEVAESTNPVRMPLMRGEIELKNATFAYEPNKNVLEHVNLKINSGEMLGVIGYSGAGKSTLVNLITRLYDVQEGSISIDGTNVTDIAIADLRSQIGMVLQETFLFVGSIAENVAYARPEASREEIIEACKVASAHDFIVKLPDGYETLIGHGGHNLSGGERQRLAIARAVLHSPRILILDEATASVDTETEKAIQEGLERLVRGRTTIAIAHRLSTLRNADRVLVLDKGKVMEIGTHEELVEKEGTYYKMLTKQREALKIRGVEVSEQELAGRAG